MLKKIMGFIAIVVCLILTAYFYGVYQNNREVSYPDKVQMQQQLEKSVQWLVNNERRILSDVNPMLWWMLFETYKISHDERIAKLLEKYHKRNKQIQYGVWAPLFDGNKYPYIDAYTVQNFPYYNQHLIYALNCATKIEKELSVVGQQNTPAFCHQAEYFYRPACTTHQLMGINFLFTKQCGFLANIDEVSQSLQKDIISQLTWDIRVVDVYLQRVLMLLITGAQDSVEPIWIQRVLDHQLGDGGWGNFVSLLGPDKGKSLGFSAKGLSLGGEKSDFHATAQGIYILSYLLNSNS